MGGPLPSGTTRGPARCPPRAVSVALEQNHTSTPGSCRVVDADRLPGTSWGLHASSSHHVTAGETEAQGGQGTCPCHVAYQQQPGAVRGAGAVCRWPLCRAVCSPAFCSHVRVRFSVHAQADPQSLSLPLLSARLPPSCGTSGGGSWAGRQLIPFQAQCGVFGGLCKLPAASSRAES